MHYVALDLNGALSSPPQPQPLCRRSRRRHSVVALTLSVLLNFYSESVDKKMMKWLLWSGIHNSCDSS